MKQTTIISIIVLMVSMALALSHVCDAAGGTFVLWNNSGQAALWNIPATGSITTATYGPISSGWAPTALGSDTSGNAYILWSSTSGQAAIWKVASSLTVGPSQVFGPYTGWTAKSLAVGPDDSIYVLWNHASDNEASIFHIALGSSFTAKAYGPFAGWQAQQIALDSNNNTRLLWSNTSTGQASLWNIASGGSPTSQTFGPYTGWQAQNIAVGSDNLARIAWNNTSLNEGSVFMIATDGSFTSQGFGPYSGWTVADLSVNTDGDSFLMWNSTANQLSLFDIPATGSFTYTPYGPYSGWRAVAEAPVGNYVPNYASLWVKGTNGIWGHSPITVYFANDLTVATPTGTTSYMAQVLNGFNEWTSLLLGGITYQQVFSASGADVQVSFSTDTTTQNKATWSANASFNSNSYFLTATTAFTASSTGTEPASLLERMGAEAFGWLLGLPQSNNPSDLTNVNTTTTSPSVPDINTVKVLYPSFYPD